MQRMYLSLQPEKTVFMKKTNTQNQKKTNPYYGLLWGFLLVLFLNGLIFPKFGRGRIIETDYGTFVGKVDSGKVKDVMIKSSHIYFTAKETDGKTITYQTGEINDPKLVDRLLSARVLTSRARFLSMKLYLRKTHLCSTSCSCGFSPASYSISYGDRPPEASEAGWATAATSCRSATEEPRYMPMLT